MEKKWKLNGKKLLSSQSVSPCIYCSMPAIQGLVKYGLNQKRGEKMEDSFIERERLGCACGRAKPPTPVFPSLPTLPHPTACLKPQNPFYFPHATDDDALEGPSSSPCPFLRSQICPGRAGWLQPYSGAIKPFYWVFRVWLMTLGRDVPGGSTFSPGSCKARAAPCFPSRSGF